MELNGNYAFDNDWIQAHQRLKSLEAVADAGTIRHLDERGLAEGWRCLEVGAGAGSIANWMSMQVGRNGYVLATDIDPRFIDAPVAGTLDVRTHDVRREPLPEAAFNLVHARMLLAHLPEREEVLGRMVDALRPGGWLVIEELDFGSVYPVTDGAGGAASRFDRAVMAHNFVLEQRGFDPQYGTRLRGALSRQGLSDIDTEGRSAICHRKSAWSLAWRLTFEQLRDDLIATNLIDESELDDVIDRMGSDGFCWMSPVLMAAWGRRVE